MYIQSMINERQDQKDAVYSNMAREIANLFFSLKSACNLAFRNTRDDFNFSDGKSLFL